MSRARARLAARMLLSHEWSDHGAYDEATCLECSKPVESKLVERNGVARLEEVVDHAADCAWLLLMKKAGLR